MPSQVEALCAASAAALLEMLARSMEDADRKDGRRAVGVGVGPTAEDGSGGRRGGEEEGDGTGGAGGGSEGDEVTPEKQARAGDCSGVGDERVLGVRRSLWGGTGNEQLERQTVMRLLSLIASSGGGKKGGFKGQGNGKGEALGEDSGSTSGAHNASGNAEGSGSVGAGEVGSRGAAGEKGGQLLRVLQEQMEMEGGDLEGLERLLLIGK
jgi:hypothetical protein